MIRMAEIGVIYFCPMLCPFPSANWDGLPWPTKVEAGHMAHGPLSVLYTRCPFWPYLITPCPLQPTCLNPALQRSKLGLQCALTHPRPISKLDRRQLSPWGAGSNHIETFSLYEQLQVVSSIWKVSLIFGSPNDSTVYKDSTVYISIIYQSLNRQCRLEPNRLTLN